MDEEEYEAEKRRIKDMTDEERKAGLDKSVKGILGSLVKIVVSLVVMWIIWQAYF